MARKVSERSACSIGLIMQVLDIRQYPRLCYDHA